MQVTAGHMFFAMPRVLSGLNEGEPNETTKFFAVAFFVMILLLSTSTQVRCL